jgi:hypothetical protein
MNWDDYSDEEEEVVVKPEITKPQELDKRQTSYYRKYDDPMSNDLKRTNSTSTKCTTSSFGYNKKYL